MKSKLEDSRNSVNDLLTFEQASQYCHLRSAYKLREAVKRGELQVIKYGAKTFRFDRSDLDRWLTSKKTKLKKGL